MLAYFHFIYHRFMKGENYLKCDKCGKPMTYFLGYPCKVILTLQQGKKTIRKYFYIHQKCFSKDLVLKHSTGMKVINIQAKVYLHSAQSSKEDR